MRSFFRKRPEIDYIWITIGHDTVDDIWVWKKFCDRFKDSGSRLYQSLVQMGFPTSRDEVDKFIELVRAYMVRPVYVVIDDYHNHNSAAMNRLLSRLVFEEITGLHLILISCTYPDICYEEMVVKGYCVLINQSALVMSKDETQEMFRMNDIDLAAEELERIYAYTDGWISGVYLALMEYKRSGKFEHFTSISRLMKTAIFDKLPGQLRLLLVKMSLFEDFTTEEAFYISECRLHPYVLTELMEEYGFMQYDEQTKKFTMHSLLRSVAYAELDHSNISAQNVFARGGEWFCQHGEYTKALLCFRYADRPDEVFSLLSGEARNDIIESAPSIVQDFFDHVPMIEKLKNPVAYLGYVYYIIAKEDTALGRKLFEEVCAECRKYSEFNERGTQFRGELCIIRAQLHFNDLNEIIADMKEADSLLQHQPSQIFRQNLLTYGTPSMTLLYYIRPGSLREVVEQEKEYACYHMRLINGNGGNWDDFFEAEYLFLTGRIGQAKELSEIVCEKARFRGQVCIVISSYFMLLRSLIYLGEEQAFYRLMKQFEQYMKNVTRPILQIDYELACSYIYACLGRNDLVASWLRDFDSKVCGRITKSSKTANVVYGLVLVNSQKWALLDILGDRLVAPFEGLTFGGLVIWGYLFKAIASEHLNKPEAAVGYMQEVLRLSEPDSIKIPCIELAGESLPILDRIPEKNKFITELRQQCHLYKKALKAFEKESHKVALTKREQELMQLVKAGYRNHEIGEQMGIALVTVEKNLTNIYRKLNVSNRAAAIARIDDYI